MRKTHLMFKCIPI